MIFLNASTRLRKERHTKPQGREGGEGQEGETGIKEEERRTSIEE